MKITKTIPEKVASLGLKSVVIDLVDKQFINEYMDGTTSTTLIAPVWQQLSSTAKNSVIKMIKLNLKAADNLTDADIEGELIS